MGRQEPHADILEHMRRHHGEVQDLALQELVKTLGISIHVIPPNDERENFTLFTAGLSDRAMSIPRGSRDDRYIELFVDLPPDWGTTRVFKSFLAASNNMRCPWSWT